MRWQWVVLMGGATRPRVRGSARVTYQTFRRSFATHLLERGRNCLDAATTMIYTHVLQLDATRRPESACMTSVATLGHALRRRATLQNCRAAYTAWPPDEFDDEEAGRQLPSDPSLASRWNYVKAATDRARGWTHREFADHSILNLGIVEDADPPTVTATSTSIRNVSHALAPNLGGTHFAELTSSDGWGYPRGAEGAGDVGSVPLTRAGGGVQVRRQRSSC